MQETIHFFSKLTPSHTLKLTIRYPAIAEPIFSKEIELKTRNSTKRRLNSAFSRYSNLLIQNTLSSIGDCDVEVFYEHGFGDDARWSLCNSYKLVTVSAEGRVENQKLNQAAVLLSFGWVFGFQLDSLEKHLITLTVLTFTVNKYH